MKILVVMKRFGANKDMVMQGFGRQIRLFEPLAKKHRIDFLCPDYKKKESKTIKRNGMTFFIKPAGFFSIFGFLSSLSGLMQKEKYDIIAATTDPVIGIVCGYYSKKYKIPLVYDLMDNFETYDSYKLPFVPYLHKEAVKNADAVITVSESLKRYVSSARKKPIYVIRNGIDLKLFRPIDKIKARKRLKLPLNAKIIVYTGHLERLKGLDVMIDAFSKVRERHPNTYLMSSGQIDKDANIKQENMMHLGFLEQNKMPLLINAADAAIIPNRVNGFTKYCFPYKLAEYMACRVPIVATAVGDVSLMLKNHPGSLCKPDNPEDLAGKIIAKFKYYKRVDYSKELRDLDWGILAKKLDKIIKKIKAGRD